MTFSFIDVLGWVGSLCVIIAYGLNSYQKLRSDSLIFYALNIIGGIFLIIYSNYKEAYAVIFINVVWVIIAVPAMLRVFFKSKGT
ncbi:MAG TPA: hypothetical protein VK589_06870 [Chryseolinea sp.]|nr:hypothetical protein [Chryseolinea sp.]